MVLLSEVKDTIWNLKCQTFQIVGRNRVGAGWLKANNSSLAGSATFCSVSLITLRSRTAKTDSAKCLTAGLVNGKEIKPRLRLPLSLSPSHLISTCTCVTIIITFFFRKAVRLYVYDFFHLLPLTFVPLTFDLFFFFPLYPLLLSLTTYCLPCVLLCLLPCTRPYPGHYPLPSPSPYPAFILKLPHDITPVLPSDIALKSRPPYRDFNT